MSRTSSAVAAGSHGHWLRSTLLRIWQRAPWHGSLTDQYNAAASRWHSSVRDLGYMVAYADLIDAADARLRRTQRAHPALPALDVGAGTGAFALSFAAWHRTVRGASALRLELRDPSESMLAIAMQQLSAQGVAATPVCGDIDSLRRNLDQYWAILCSHALEHTPDVDRALVTLHDALTPGGLLLLVVSHPHWCTALLQIRWRNNSWSASEMSELLAGAGFVRISPFRFRKGPPSRTSIGFIAFRESGG